MFSVCNFQSATNHRLYYFVARIFLILGIISLLLLGGCSHRGQADKQVTTITFWHGINPPENRDIFQELVTKFNQKNPDLKVEAIYIGQPHAQLPKIFASTISNQPPDILWFVPQITGKLNE